MPKKEIVLKHLTIYVAYLITVWCFYRFLFKLPDEIEELVVKPIIWILPVFYIIGREKTKLDSLGITFKNLFPSIYLALGLGAFFVLEAVVVNILKYGKLNFGANLGDFPFMVTLGISFATSISEEIAYRGYIFGRLWYVLKNEWTANFITTVLWVGIHIPIAFVVWKLDLSAGLVYLMLTAIFGMGSAFVYARTRNIFASIFLHVLWAWPIILFR
ncbi:MAG: CPBP family intramembrane metalloprotease [bacterium]|nr:CPBP family intramembrane metalloprotease [bacterium]